MKRIEIRPSGNFVQKEGNSFQTYEIYINGIFVAATFGPCSILAAGAAADTFQEPTLGGVRTVGAYTRDYMNYSIREDDEFFSRERAYLKLSVEDD